MEAERYYLGQADQEPVTVDREFKLPSQRGGLGLRTSMMPGQAGAPQMAPPQGLRLDAQPGATSTQPGLDPSGYGNAPGSFPSPQPRPSDSSQAQPTAHAQETPMWLKVLGGIGGALEGAGSGMRGQRSQTIDMWQHQHAINIHKQAIARQEEQLKAVTKQHLLDTYIKAATSLPPETWKQVEPLLRPDIEKHAPELAGLHNAIEGNPDARQAGAAALSEQHPVLRERLAQIDQDVAKLAPNKREDARVKLQEKLLMNPQTHKDMHDSNRGELAAIITKADPSGTRFQGMHYTNFMQQIAPLIPPGKDYLIGELNSGNAETNQRIGGFGIITPDITADVTKKLTEQSALEKGKVALAGKEQEARNDATNKTVGNLYSPAALENAAQSYALDRHLPPSMPRGQAGLFLSTKIQNRAAEILAENGETSKATAIRQTAAKSVSAALTVHDDLETKIRSFEGAFRKNVDMAETYSKAVDRAGVPFWNKWTQAGGRNVTADEDIGPLDIAVKESINELAKLASTASGSGVTAEKEIEKWEKLLRSSQTEGQFMKNLGAMRGTADNRVSALSDERKRLLDLLGGSGGGGRAKPKGAFNQSRYDELMKQGKSKEQAFKTMAGE